MNGYQITNILLTVLAVVVIALFVCVCILGVATGDVDPQQPDTIVWDFEANLSGFNQIPIVNSPAIGNVKFRIDDDSTRIFYSFTIENATNILSAGGATVNCGVEGINGSIIMFLAGEMQGGYNNSYELSAERNFFDIINTSCGDNVKELINALNTEKLYVNVRSAAHPTGEIRGQIKPIPVVP